MVSRCAGPGTPPAGHPGGLPGAPGGAGPGGPQTGAPEPRGGLHRYRLHCCHVCRTPLFAGKLSCQTLPLGYVQYWQTPPPRPPLMHTSSAVAVGLTVVIFAALLSSLVRCRTLPLRYGLPETPTLLFPNLALWLMGPSDAAKPASAPHVPPPSVGFLCTCAGRRSADAERGVHATPAVAHGVCMQLGVDSLRNLRQRSLCHCKRPLCHCKRPHGGTRSSLLALCLQLPHGQLGICVNLCSQQCTGQCSWFTSVSYFMFYSVSCSLFSSVVNSVFSPVFNSVSDSVHPPLHWMLSPGP